MRTGVRVRPAVLNDVRRLADLADTTAPSSPRGKVPPDRARRYTQLIGQPDRVVLVAEEEATEAVLGVVVATEGEVGPLSPVSALVVNHLVVEAAQRRRGIGKGLLAGVVRAAESREIEHVIVSVNTSDRDANRFLARLGFGPLVVRRIASTETLRRSLGMAEVRNRATLRRRRLSAVRPARIISRGA